MLVKSGKQGVSGSGGRAAGGCSHQRSRLCLEIVCPSKSSSGVELGVKWGAVMSGDVREGMAGESRTWPPHQEMLGFFFFSLSQMWMNVLKG